MKVMCNQRSKVFDLMASRTFAVDEGGQLATYHFCSDEHVQAFARRKGMSLGKD